MNVTNLNVGNINNINWNVFRDSVFRFGFTTQINGNIKMASFKSTHLFADSISGVNTDNFLTTTTNQTITSVIRFVNVDAENVICETVNGVNITKEAAIVDETIKEVKIQGPVKAVSIEIDGDMYIDGPINETAFHVQGTSVEDLYQFYHEKVTIEGDLYLNNILLSEDASVFVNEELFTMNMLDRFWLKNKRQVSVLDLFLTCNLVLVVLFHSHYFTNICLSFSLMLSVKQFYSLLSFFALKT